MIVAGIDPSLTGTGIAILRDGQPIALHKIGYPGRSGASDIERLRRVGALVTDITKFITTANPDLVVIESPAYGQYLPSTCDRNILWGTLVHRYTIDHARTNHGYAGITPTCLKRFVTGKGNADKAAVVAEITNWWPNLPALRNDNIADAAGLASMGAARYGDPLPRELRRVQRESLEAVSWPVGMEEENCGSAK